MKLLFIVSTLQMGGAERVLVEIANRWSEKHKISVLTIDKGEDFFKLNDKVTRYNLAIERKNRYNPLPHFRIIAGIKKITKKINPDFVISFVIKTNIFTLLALGNTKFKTIVCEHSVINRSDIDRGLEFLRKKLYKKAYKIGVLSKSIKQEFIEKYKKYDKNRIIVIPNALNIPKPQNTSKIDFQKICNEKLNNIPVIISLGRLSAVKRFDKLIKIFSIVNKQTPDTRLIIFGEGNERKKLENLISELKLKHKVFLPGKTNNIESALTQSTIFACTSEVEGFGMAIIEAMNYKIPIISFDIPYLGDIITNNKNGLLVEKNNLEEYAEKIKYLLNNNRAVKKLTESGYNTTKQFNPEAIDKIWFEKVLH